MLTVKQTKLSVSYRRCTVIEVSDAHRKGTFQLSGLHPFCQATPDQVHMQEVSRDVPDPSNPCRYICGALLVSLALSKTFDLTSCRHISHALEHSECE